MLLPDESGTPWKDAQFLGKGGMGLVYKATHKTTGREEVLKILHSELAEDPKCVKRFEREARNLARINHENVVRCYGTHRIKDRYVLVMEFVEGKTLKRLLDGGGPLDWRHAVDQVRQILKGLECLHAAGILHRDLKLENIIETPSGQLKILDFGIAIGDNDEVLTRTGWLTGTPRYASPEVLNGKKFDVRSDVRSVGLCLYELVTGISPFRADDTAAMMLLICNGTFTSPRSVNTTIPEWLDSSIQKALATDPAARFQTAAEFLQYIEAHCPDSTVEQRPQTVMGDGRVPVRLGVLASAIATGFLAGVGWGYFLSRAPVAGRPEIIVYRAGVPPTALEKSPAPPQEEAGLPDARKARAPKGATKTTSKKPKLGKKGKR